MVCSAVVAGNAAPLWTCSTYCVLGEKVAPAVANGDTVIARLTLVESGVIHA